jgi:hypothetical protein
MSSQISSSEVLLNQVRQFVASFESANKKRKMPRSKEDYRYIEVFFNKVIADRNKRADVIDAPEHQKAIKIARKLLPYPTEMESCMDGRIFGPLIGLYGHIGGTLSLAGGILHDFVRSEEDQKLHLLPHSNFAHLLKKHLERPSVESIVEILDSHIGCAARETEEIAKGKYPKDHGLLTDVSLKLEMCEAMKAFVEDEYDGAKIIYPVNISLDPHSGFLYMGLATARAIDFAIKHGGFTDEVLNELVQKHWIISTKHIADEPEIRSIFEKNIVAIDMTKKYGETADAIWEKINAMKEKLLPIILQKLLIVYPYIKNNQKRKKEFDERAIIILINAFTGFLHQMQYPQYPYAEHHEEGVFVAKGNNPPYEVALFAESSLDMKNLPNNIELASSIVRNNRKVERVIDTSGLFKNLDSFVCAPVGVLLQVKILERMEKDDWKLLLAINWSDLQHIGWETMADTEFMSYLENKMGSMPLTVANAINKLRKRTAMLYDKEQPIASNLIENDIMVLPIISDISKRVRCVIPFLKIGFH